LSKSISYGTISSYRKSQSTALIAVERSDSPNVVKALDIQTSLNTQSSIIGRISAVLRRGMQQVSDSRKSSGGEKVGKI
jgi:hypothetical protein